MSAARYAVIGNPVAHSKSPAIHEAFARETAQNLSYERICAPIESFVASVDAFFEAGGAGLNVTLPFKLAALRYTQNVSERAVRAGAANTLRRDADGVFADNTDGVGLVRDLARLAGAGAPPLRAARVLIAGAGGASRGIIGPLLDAGVARIAIVNRTRATAQALVLQFQNPSVELSAHEYGAAWGESFDIILHATPASLFDARVPLHDDLISEAKLVYDLAYGRGTASDSTEILRHARALGVAHTCDGLGMLVEQAAESFFLWRNIRPQSAPVLAALRAAQAHV